MSAATATEVEPDTSAEQPSVRKNRHRAVPLVNEFRVMSGAGGVSRLVEVRAGTKKNTMVVEGEPIVYDTRYDVHDMFGAFREQILKGALTDVLDEVDTRLLLNHDGLALARNTSGTMELADSDSGLKFEAELDMRQQLANDFVIAVERGDMSEMSVGMIVGKDLWGEEKNADGTFVEIRDIERLADLLDVSGVTYAASPTTTIQAAQRMADRLSPETLIRLRKLEVDLRSGAAKPEDVLDALVALRAGKAPEGDERAQRAADGLSLLLESVSEEDQEEVEAVVEERAEEAAEEEAKPSPSLIFAMELRKRTRR